MADARIEWLDTVRKWKLDPDEPATDEYWAPELETISRDELESIQGEKLVKAVGYMFDRSQLFRRKCKELGLEPGDVRGIEDLAKLPIMTKDDMSEDLEANPPWGTYMAVDTDDWLRNGWQVFQTSGTTAAPRPFFYTQFDREMWAWTNARALYAMGIRGGQDVGMCCFGYGPHVAMWGLHIGLELMGVPIVPAGGLDTNARGFAIQRFETTVLSATPSYALYLGSTMLEAGLDPAGSSVQRIVALGEPLPSSSRERIEDMWNASVHQFYGCTEAAPSCGGYTCPSAVHFMEDTHILEAVDPDTLKPVSPGQPGLSVVTNLCSQASPQIRFVVGDFTTLDYEPCECGRTHVRAVDGFAGRADDMLNIRGVTIFPSAVEDVVRRFSELGDEFEIVLETEDDLDEITIVAEPAADLPESQHDELNEGLVEAFRANLELRPNVEFKPHGTLEKPEFKASRVRDLRD